jgi:adenine-specific DNA-methyltransferase
MARNDKKLKLSWYNKDKSLFYNLKKREYLWVDKKDPRVSEPRILLEKTTCGDKDTQNILIKGDNLLALKALLQDFRNKIKLIYIDPPFNTGVAFEHYDDGLEHSIWLTMMRDRLVLLRELLARDGAIFVHIDYNEEPYLRVVMDEIFGRDNYRNTIVVPRVKKNIRERDKVKALNFGHGPILFYAKSEKTLINIPTIVQEKGERWHAFDAPGIRKTMEYELFGHKPPKGRHWMYAEQRAKELVESGELRKNPRTGKPQYRLAASSETMVDTLWADIQESSFSWDFKGGEKNEKLIRRIIEMVTDPGDWILDSFLGSGTTAAVAHKLSRRWIGIELGEHAETHCIKRLKAVIQGADSNGITRDVQWKGGGGFKYFELGDSLFVADDDLRLTILNPKVYNGVLIRAVLKVEGFKLLNPDNALHGISGKTIAHVTEQYLNQDYINVLLEEVGDMADYLVVYAKTISNKLKLPENVEVRRIPDVLLRRFKV